jgi:hypothetical protein
VHFRSVKSCQVGLKAGYTALYTASFTAHLQFDWNAGHESTEERGTPYAEKVDSLSMIFFWKRQIIAKFCGTKNAPR